MNNQEKLLSLLQPKDYISKIKLYCRDCNVKSLVKKQAKPLNEVPEKEMKQQKRITIIEIK